MFRTIRSRYRRIVPALIGSVAILAAVFLAQTGTQSRGDAAPQLAAAERSADGTASRGGERSADGGLALQIATAAQNGEFGSPQDAADATTTTTAAPVPTAIAAPKPAVVEVAKPALTAPPTTSAPVTTAKPKPAPPKTPTTTVAPKPVPQGAPNGAICAMSPGAWCEVAKCESGDKNVNTGNGYSGYFQFSPSTWRAMGGTGIAYDNSAAKQLELAKKLLAKSGAGQWPHCGRFLR